MTVGHVEIRQLLELEPRTVIITLVGDGCLVVQAGQEPVHISAHVVTVVDTVGAGDAFNGRAYHWVGTN